MKRVPFVISIVLIISSLFIFGVKSGFGVEDLKSDYSKDNLLRLHVIANSNSFEDQRIKREIKEEIVSKTSNLFISLEDPLEAKVTLQNNILSIEKIVKDKLKEYNKEYGGKVQVGRFYFPKRSYGKRELSSGEYEALKVVIGEGMGNNWWCVLFPPLCFIDTKEDISEKELDNLLEGDRLVDGMKVEYRFKLVELAKQNPGWVNSKLKLVNILESSFPDISRFFSPKGKESPTN